MDNIQSTRPTNWSLLSLVVGVVAMIAGVVWGIALEMTTVGIVFVVVGAALAFFAAVYDKISQR